MKRVLLCILGVTTLAFGAAVVAGIVTGIVAVVYAAVLLCAGGVGQWLR